VPPQVYAKLVGGHKGAVTALLPVGATAPGGPDRLLSAGADGTIAVWEPSTAGRWCPGAAARLNTPDEAERAHRASPLLERPLRPSTNPITVFDGMRSCAPGW